MKNHKEYTKILPILYIINNNKNNINEKINKPGNIEKYINNINNIIYKKRNKIKKL